mmetsp:Transcript_8313/g.16449  ORF Transcript_8313/g.16449 Transcript_8313/m.16449 type:complete len:381 (+) Transcript_8313:79-1221(+)
MEKGDDPYQILGLSKSDVSLDPSCIKKNFRQLARIHHPDKNRGEEKEIAAAKFSKINHAYEVLRDEESRRSYDLCQLHSKQQGYDPNGPTYYDQNCGKDNNSENVDGVNNGAPKKKQTKKTSTTTSTTTSRTTTSTRTASASVTDKVSGKRKILSFTTGSNGITTVETRSSDGTISSYSVSRLNEEKHKGVYELFREHFGTDKANDFFNDEGVGGNGVNGSNGVNGGSQKTPKSPKSKSDVTKKKATEKRRTKNLNPLGSPREVRTASYAHPTPDTNVTAGFAPSTTNNNATKPKKVKKKKAVQVPDANKKILSTSKTYSNINHDNNTHSIDRDDDNIQSMSMKERIVINPNTKRKEVVSEITVTKFDGSIEIRTERRQM